MSQAIYKEYLSMGEVVGERDTHQMRSLALIGLASLVIAYLTSIKAFGIDRDYYNYLLFYETVQGRISYTDLRFESGFVYLSWLFRNLIGFDFPTYILCITAFSLSVKFWFLYRYTKFPILAIASYMMMFYPIHEYTQLRISMALSLSILGVHFLVQKQLFKSAFLFIVAPLFHITAITVSLCALIYFIRNRYLGVALAGIFGLLAFYAGDIILSNIVIFSSELNSLSDYYINNSEFIEQANIFSVSNLTIYFVIIFCLLRQWAIKSDLDYILFIFVLASVVSLILLIDIPVYSQRLKELLSVFMIPIVFRNYISRTDILAIVIMIGASLWALVRYTQQGIIFS